MICGIPGTAVDNHRRSTTSAPTTNSPNGVSYRYEIGYSNRPDTKVILEYTYGRSIPVSVRAQ